MIDFNLIHFDGKYFYMNFSTLWGTMTLKYEVPHENHTCDDTISVLISLLT
jgi:hypothetical protein